MASRHRCRRCSIRFDSKKALQKHNTQRHSLVLRCGRVLLKRNEWDEYKCPSHDCTFATQDHYAMHNHLRRDHLDVESISGIQGRSNAPENEDFSLQLPHHGVDNEQRMVDSDHDDDDVVSGSDPNEEDMVIGSPDDWGDRDLQLHSSRIPSYRSSVHHSPSYDRDVSTQVPPAQHSNTPTVPESATPAMRNESDTFGEFCPRYT